MKKILQTVLVLCLWSMLGFGCASTPKEDPNLEQAKRIPELQPNPFLEQDRESAAQEMEGFPSKRPAMSEEATPTPPLRRVSRSGDLRAPQVKNLSSGQESSRLGAGPAEGYRAREAEQERRFRQDQESRIRDYRRAFPHETAPRPDSYRSYEGSRPPRRY